MEVETKFTDTEPVESPSVAWHADFDTRSRGVSGFIEKTNDDCTVGGNTRGVQRETPRVNIRDTIRMAIREISSPPKWSRGARSFCTMEIGLAPLLMHSGFYPDMSDYEI